jgi:hypothetical protein
MQSIKQKYSNCKIYHPSGKLMCVNSEKKGRWYVEKTGAKVISTREDGSLSEIQLTFEPKGHGFEEDDLFGLSIQETRCVVTGETDINQLTKHHIVPISYRKHLPLEYKSRNHHDVVYITKDKHDKYERIGNQFRIELAKKYGSMSYIEATEHLAKVMNSEHIQLIKKVRGYAMWLLNSDELPTTKQIEMTDVVVDYISKKYSAKTEDIKPDDIILNKLIDDIQAEITETILKNKIDPYKDLIDKVGDYDVFVKLWRQHFIDTMEPKFMPTGWSVDYKTKTNL